MRLFWAVFFLFCGLSSAEAAPQHGIAMHGDLKYQAGFDHFAYVNPKAPKGGSLRLADIGGFDSLNPFILKGSPAPGLNALSQGLVYESLMVQSDDEPFSMYGLIADTVDVAPDRSRVTFHINAAARWHDGQPITAQDVAWTFETLMKVGAPFFKAYFGDVEKVRVDDAQRVTFLIKNPENRELPLVLAQMVVLPKHFWTAMGRDISQGSLTIPLGSGAYKITDVKPGAHIEYTRVPEAWAADLGVNRGRYNFDRIVFDTYRDANVALEAFFSGNYDVRLENVAKLWVTGYTAPAVTDGRITRAEIPHAQPVGMQGFIFNTRRPQFADRNVRQALSYAFDFEWANKQLADGVYTRTNSFFENSDLGADGVPNEKERALLTPFKDQLPGSIWTAADAPPVTDGSGNARGNLKIAAEMLDRAGYKLGSDGVRVNDQGVRLAFEFIDANPAMERWVNPFLKNLKKIGVDGRLRVVDPTQYQNRMQNFDFDMTTAVMGQSDSPGNEQRDYWSSAKADIPGSRNLMGIKDKVVDALVEQIIQAPTREDLVARTRALDRVLLSGHYLIPNWHYPKWRVAWWRGFYHPDVAGTKSLGVTDTWWYKAP